LKRLLLLTLSTVACLHSPAGPPVVRVPVQQRLFTALSRFENCRAWRNPGCLRFAGQAGAVRGPGGYAVFRNLLFGERALRRQIEHGQGQTVFEFLTHYNPGHANYPARIASIAQLSLADVL
jgi:hypothetical protein